jgi:hypothetical protein
MDTSFETLTGKIADLGATAIGIRDERDRLQAKVKAALSIIAEVKRQVARHANAAALETLLLAEIELLK